MNAYAGARSLIPAGLGRMFDHMVACRDWFGVLRLVSPGDCVPLAEALWPHLTAEERPKVLADAISGRDAPSRWLEFLRRALDDLARSGHRAFDGTEATSLFDALPPLVAVHRGTVQAEIDGQALGICWTLDRDTAAQFARRHARLRDGASRPVVLTAKIARDAIAGLLTARGEDEVLLAPFGIRECAVETLRN